MNHYKLIIAYDGTDYAGWQRLDHAPTVTGTLEQTFKKVFDQDIRIIGASRTDAGVHALGQVALFKTDLNIPAPSILKAWNNLLPASIMIRSLERVDASFFPQSNVRQKTYHYYFSLERPLPFVIRYCWQYRYAIDFNKLKACLQVFVGTHDFRSFCTLDDPTSLKLRRAGDKNTVRTIDSIEVRYLKKYKVYRIEVKGHSFLHFMIRRIVGACLHVAAHDEMLVSILEKALADKNPRQCFPKAEAAGLVLYKILYAKTSLH